MNVDRIGPHNKNEEYLKRENHHVKTNMLKIASNLIKSKSMF